jgi:ferredoxin
MKAILEPSKCVGCSICVGSCHVDAIAIASADFTQDEPSGKQDLVIYKCLYSVCETPAGISCHTREAPCIAGIHPGQIRKDLETGKATGVALVCCEDCFYRFGKDWQEKRLTRKRRPTFHRRAPLERVKIITTAQNITRELRQFVQELKTAAGGDSVDHLTVVEHKKLNPVLALAVTVVFFGLVPLLSNTNLGFYTTGEKTIIFDFKYVSSPTEFQQLQSGGAHMQSAQPIVKSRSTVKLNLYNAEKQLFYSKEFKPRGLRQDIAIFVFDEIKTNENQFDVELVETAFPERKLQLLSVQVNQKDGTVIVLKEGQFQKL